MAPLTCLLMRQDVTGLVDVERARRATQRFAAELGFEPFACGEIILILSELGNNLLDHGRGGEIRLSAQSRTEGMVLVVEATDAGPGIEDLSLALSDGFSTGKGLGQGLPMVCRLADEVEISTGPAGTRFAASLWNF
jgi:serine/threonine-protein kinase RsbT